jgi:hypothetical protein
MKIQCNKCGKYFEVDGEWGYCPFCENDNVEVPKRFEQWGYESFKDNETGEIKSDYLGLLNEQNDNIKVLEKALELACEDKPRPIKYYGNYMGSINDYIEFYKTKAKEMMKSE